MAAINDGIDVKMYHHLRRELALISTSAARACVACCGK